jgi:integrase
MLSDRRKEYLSGLIEGHLARMKKRGRVSPNYIPDYRRELWRMTNALDRAELNTSPSKIGEEEIDYILEEYAGDLRTSTKKWYLAILNGYLQTNKNHIVQEMHLGWPKDSRLHVDWLSWEEAVVLLDAAQGPGIPLVHLELRLMMRRCEVRRLTMGDIMIGVMDVHGKGRYGGKWRTLAWAPETLDVMLRWIDVREQMIQEARAIDPRAEVPEEFLIYRKNGKLSPYQDSGLDRILESAAQRANIVRKFGHHTLRRSGARFAMEADPSCMPTLVEVLGHEDEAQTRRYCGLTIDNMAALNVSVSDRLEKTRERMRLTGETPKPPSVRIVR